MNITSKSRSLLYFILTALAGLFATLPASAGKTYNGSVEIKEVTVAKSGEVRIVFSSTPETVWFCPGVNGKKVEKGLELTFVRAWHSKRPKVDYPVEVVKDAKGLVYAITIPAPGGPLFYHNGRELVQLQPKKVEKDS